MSQDFQDPNFDPISYLNNRFPDQQSLVDLDQQISKLNSQLQSVNKQLIDQIHQHAMMNIQISQQIKKAKSLSKQIISQIGIIKQKAKKSQQIVYDMCKDLKSLDIAKKNLTFSIDALKKFIMMVDAIQKLRQACQNKKYVQVQHLLSAFNQLSNHFKKYQQIPQIQQLYKDKQAIVEQLYAQITEDFQSYQNDTSNLTPNNMNAAAKIIQLLGTKYFRKFVAAINNMILAQYQEQFGSPQNSILQNTQRRYGYIKRKMQQFQTKFKNVFPQKWGMDCLIYYQFCSITRLHLTMSLQRVAGQVNVAVLMKSLQVSIKFQNKITQTMKQKYTQTVKQNLQNNSGGPCSLQSLPKFTGSISNSFQPHLYPYIQSQQQSLLSTLQKSLQQDKLTQIRVYNSSIVLFHGIKNMIKRASTYSRGSLLLQILSVVKRGFSTYCDRCFQKTKNASEDTICWVINTAQYCKNIIQGVNQVFTQAINQGYEQYINFSDQQDLFSNLISKCIELFISQMQNRLQAAFIQLTKVQWQMFQDFGSQSSYVRDAKQIIKGNFLKVKDQLVSVYLGLYVDKVIVLVANKFIQNILKCRRLPDMAFQVLLMDYTQLKQTLLSLIKIDANIYSTQKQKTKHITFTNKSFYKGEQMIKLLSFTNQQFAQKFQSMMQGAGVGQLEKLLLVKGAKKTDFAALVRTLENKYS